MNNVFASKKLTKGSPFLAIEHFYNNKATGQLRLLTAEVTWSVRLDHGKITYARHNIEPFDQLVCHLRHMSHQVPSLTKEFRSQICALFDSSNDHSLIDQSLDPEDAQYRCDEYEALCWLSTQKDMNSDRMAQIVEAMTKDAIESLFWLEEVSYQFSDRLGNPTTFCDLNLKDLAAYCQQRFKLWQMLSPQVYSPFQRPYYFGQSSQQKQLIPELKLQEKFSTILKGFSFHHLSVLMRQDELKIAGSLLPYIYEEVVVLRDPQPPFNKLPRVPEKLPEILQNYNPTLSSQPKPDLPPVNVVTNTGLKENTYTIACVDDSPTVLTQIGRILNASNLKFVAINDSLKAPMQILKLKPDLILLDVNMPKVDGYKLCSLLRNNPALKGIPIVMVTGNSGIIDRAKAKMAGSTDFLSKPFTEEGLLKMVFRHLC